MYDLYQRLKTKSGLIILNGMGWAFERVLGRALELSLDRYLDIIPQENNRKRKVTRGYMKYIANPKSLRYEIPSKN